ncbi:MAG: autotransporter-associated beta strand repeat-containing protein [Planctomycetes bacterium]|nr:autotransporter-associated beta strand repeat-containing protein [Planctomycetota bacterium]
MLGQHHTATTLLRRLRTPSFLTVLVVALGAVHAHASEWIISGDGTYSIPANWSGGVPNGVDATADFSKVDISTDVIVNINADVTLGHLLFGDADLSSAGTLALDNVDGTPLVITLDATTKPTISAGALSPMATFDDSFLGVLLAGTNGFRKLGPGILSLEALIHTLTGPVDIEEGTLRLGDGITFGDDSPITFYDGATLDTFKNLHQFPSYNVVSGATANIISRRAAVSNLRHLMGPGTGEGAGINVFMDASSTRLQLQSSDTGGFDSWTITNQDTDTLWLRMMFNNGGNSLNGNVWADAAVVLNGINASGRTNSGGNDISIGSLAGDALSGLSGGVSGTTVRWHIGSLNTDTEFAGVIQFERGGNGMSIEKVGTGTLTFSGWQNTTMSKDNADISLTGGVVRVSEGTLALTNTFDRFVGGTATTMAMIDVNEGAFFDVSGTTNPYSSAHMQQLQGSGTIVGTYNNAAATDPNFSDRAGIILPGNVSAAGTRTNFTNKSIPTAGTMTFDGDLQLNGGSIEYDMSLNADEGNDLIHVTGSTALNAGTIFVNYLAGAPLGGSYTVITSDGGFTGSADNISIIIPGRGTAPTPVIDGNDLVFMPAADAVSANLTWVGTSSTWDIETSSNWDNGGTADVYFDGDNVTFDATGNTDVNVVTTVSPGSIVVTDGTAYSFAGSGSIQGSGSLVVNQTNLSMHLANGFTGDATLNQTFGFIDMGNFIGALGSGNLHINGDVLIDSDGWASGDKGALNNSSITIPAGSKLTMQVHSGRNRSGAFFLNNITGDGDLELAVSHNQKYYRPVFTGFTGNLHVLPFGEATVTGLRLNENALILPDSVVTLEGAIVQMGDSVNDALIEFGELHGDAGTVLAAAETGNPGPPGWNTTYRIGALGTDSDFAGIIQDDGYDAPGCCTAALSHLTKVGAGTLTLTGSHANTYTGHTTVEAGTLSIDAAYLADTADVLLTADATLNLDFVGTDTINALLFNGESQVTGTWGAVGSGAANETTLITGTGLLQVTAIRN